MAVAASTGDHDPNKSKTAAAPPKGRTSYISPTFVSSGNPCLDFFFHVLPDTKGGLHDLLKGAWDHDPLKALKLVANLRAVRGTGKSDKESFYNAALWLHDNHPTTLASNVASFADLGCFNDFLEILSRILKHADGNNDEIESLEIEIECSRSACMFARYDYGFGFSARSRRRRRKRLQEKRVQKMKAFAVDKLKSDPNFKFLHDCVSDLFAKRLTSDMKLLDSGDLDKISTSAKWCPSLDSDLPLVYEAIAKKLFPEEEAACDRLKEQVLLPLRKAMHLTEVYMEAKDWGSLPYDKVASEDMTRHKDEFMEHDKKRFQKFLERVKSGEAKMAGGEVLPHKIIEELYNEDPVEELQWKRVMYEVGKLKNCLPICDVSSDVRQVSLALGVLVSELNQGHWKGKLITLGHDPKLHLVKGESLSKKMERFRTFGSSYEKNLQKVFDVLLQVAVNGKLRSEDMVKRVFVFSDMDFGDYLSPPRSKEDLETDYEKIQRKFRENGYGDCVPEMVFWNLSNSYASSFDHSRNGKATPVVGNQPGVALVSGYSKNLLTLFSQHNTATLDPEAIMEAAISGEEYQSLLLVD